MPIPQEGGLPANFVLESGMTVRLTAVDPTTGAVVSGVVISGASIDIDQIDPSVTEPVFPSVVSGAYLAGEPA